MHPHREEETQKIVAQAGARPMLTALWDGGGLTTPIPAQSRVIVGRGSSAEVPIDHPSISRRHAALHVGAELVVEDLGSSNGTKVRAQTLAQGELATVRWGEPFELGGVVVALRPPTAENEPLPAEPGEVASMEETLRLIDLVAPTPISVLLLGETGVGKGYLARRIVQRSPRASGPWLHLNCAALPEHLLESELFGYERGAFTGATQTKPGLLEAASGGTVFLDEVGDLPPSVQAKLLTALERGEVIRIGGLKPVRFDVRFISATNRLLSATSRSSFRPDLYYRLAGMPIIVPPLRDRRDELPGLLGTLVKESSAKLGRLPPHVDASVLTALAGYDWPGNIRELASVLERALLLSGPTMLAHHLGLPRRAVASSPPPSSRPAPRLDDAPTANTGLRLADEVNEIERRRVLEALERSAGNQVRAAEALGISRRTLISRMVAFGIRRPRKG